MAEQSIRVGAADIAGLIRREIAKGTLQLNDRLPAERQMAANYGVARGTIREALNRLEEEGFVEIRAGSGTYVVYKPVEQASDAIVNANPLELIDARFALEPHMCRLAVLHGRKTNFKVLEELCEKMDEVVRDPLAWSDIDADFHTALAECSGNGLLIWVAQQINSVRREDEWTRMRNLTLDEKMIGVYNVQHRQIVNAIRTREPERAANLMKAHLESARLSLTRAAET